MVSIIRENFFSTYCIEYPPKELANLRFIYHIVSKWSFVFYFFIFFKILSHAQSSYMKIKLDALNSISIGGFVGNPFPFAVHSVKKMEVIFLKTHSPGCMCGYRNNQEYKVELADFFFFFCGDIGIWSIQGGPHVINRRLTEWWPHFTTISPLKYIQSLLL